MTGCYGIGHMKDSLLILFSDNQILSGIQAADPRRLREWLYSPFEDKSQMRRSLALDIALQ